MAELEIFVDDVFGKITLVWIVPAPLQIPAELTHCNRPLYWNFLHISANKMLEIFH